MHFEREPREEGTQLEAGLRRYARTVYSMAQEGEETFDRRLMHLLFSVQDDLLTHGSLTDDEGARKRGELMPSRAEYLPFSENLATLQLVPLRLIASDCIPVELLTPKAIDIALNTAVSSDGGQHIECIDGSTELECAKALVCPARACVDESVKLLYLLSVEYCYDDVLSSGRTRASDNISALKIALDRLGLIVQTEFDLVEDHMLQNVYRVKNELFSGVTGPEITSESDS